MTSFFSCSDRINIEDPEVNQNIDNTKLIAEHIVTTKAGLQIVLAEIFKYPNLHSGLKSESDIIFRNDCPCISPDPTLPITSYPISYDLNFGTGCMPDGVTEVKGKVRVTLDGLLCVSEGTTANIDFFNNFNIDGVDLDNEIDLTFITEDSNGNLCFESNLSDLTIEGSNGSTIEVKSTTEGKLTLVDALANNDPSSFQTYLDDYTCQSYASMDVCIDNVDYVLTSDTDLKTNPLCACPVGGILTGTDSMGNPISIDFSANSACDGTVIINNTTQTLNACL